LIFILIYFELRDTENQLGFNDLGRFGDPYFSFQKQFLFTVISTLPKIEKKMWEVTKKFKISVHGTTNPAISRLQGA